MSTMTFDPGYAGPYAGAPGARRSAGELRLTRRGRAVVFVAAVLAAVAIGLFVAAGSAATETPAAVAPTEVVTVAPGETLWGIASDLVDGTETSVRQMMIEIERLNALETPVLQAGQRLRVPA